LPEEGEDDRWLVGGGEIADSDDLARWVYEGNRSLAGTAGADTVDTRWHECTLCLRRHNTVMSNQTSEVTEWDSLQGAAEEVIERSNGFTSGTDEEVDETVLEMVRLDREMSESGE
jgi:hypothetical protein